MDSPAAASSSAAKGEMGGSLIKDTVPSTAAQLVRTTYRQPSNTHQLRGFFSHIAGLARHFRQCTARQPRLSRFDNHTSVIGLTHTDVVSRTYTPSIV